MKSFFSALRFFLFIHSAGCTFAQTNPWLKEQPIRWSFILLSCSWKGLLEKHLKNIRLRKRNKNYPGMFRFYLFQFFKKYSLNLEELLVSMLFWILDNSQEVTWQSFSKTSLFFLELCSLVYRDGSFIWVFILSYSSKKLF